MQIFPNFPIGLATQENLWWAVNFYSSIVGCKRTFVSGFAKTRHNVAKTEIQFIASWTWKPHSSTIQTHQIHQWQGYSYSWPGLLSQVGFCWPCKCMMVHYRVHGAIGGTNKAAWGVKLLPVMVLAWHVECGCFCALLKVQQSCLCPYGWYGLPSAPHPPWTLTLPPPTRPPPINWICDIGWVLKNCLKIQLCILARWLN